jgi:hypothetical protein
VFRHEEYQDALRAFEEARQIRETASVVLNIGSCLHALFRNGEALAAFERFLQLRGERLTAEESRRVNRATQALRARVAELTVETNVADARLLIDGRPVSGRPIYVDADRDVSVEAQRDGYLSARSTVHSSGTSPVRVSLRLERVARTGQLIVTASVPSAVVVLDGREVGRAPWQGNLQPGSYDLEVRAIGYEPAPSRLEIVAGENLRHEVHMVPLPRPSFAAGAQGRASPVAAGPIRNGERRETDPRAGGRSGSGVLPWLLAGAGVVVVGAIVGIWLLASQPLEGDWTLSPP